MGPTLLERLIVEKNEIAKRRELAKQNPKNEELIPLLAEMTFTFQESKKYMPVGFILMGLAGGLAGFMGWTLAGGSYARIVKGCLLASAMSAVGCFCVVVGLKMWVLGQIPVVNGIVHLVAFGVMVFGASYRVATNSNLSEDGFDLGVCGVHAAVSIANAE